MEKKVVSWQKDSFRDHMTRIQVNSEEPCVGCYLCVYWCSVKHYTLSSRSASRIRIQWDREQLLPSPCVCQQCEDSPCVEACPYSALTREGYIHVDEEACTGCRICEPACPHGAIHVYRETAVVCDLCGGTPLCVKVCPVGLLEVVE